MTGAGHRGLAADQADDPSGSLDLVGGRVFDPGRGLDTTGTVSVADGLIEGVRPAADAEPGRRRIDVSGRLVTPGLVDLHTHLYPGVSHYGIEPDEHCLGRGVTTAVDAGSAGAQTFPGLRRYVIERSRTSILAFLNIAVEGMISTLVGELEDIRWASPAQAVARAREHPDLIVGIKVRLGHQMVGDDPEPALRLAREAADPLGLPLMVHVIDLRPGLAWLLPRLHRGDIVTHCFHGNEGGILDPDGRVLPEAVSARGRGVLFDVGHGAGSFSYRVARRAIAQEFPPDTISSDLHAHNAAGPVFDQATTLSKLLHVGMTLADVIRATTSTPALAIGRAARAGTLAAGTLAAGAVADVSVFELRAGHWALPDAAGETEHVEQLLVPTMVIRAGQVCAIGPPAAGLRAAGTGP
ncbi:MAG TPA: amidohydrolase/deacetylase family metallohydrolase [Streptosporangiaceae bacterium]